MLRENKAEREQMEMVCIEEMVPKDHILRKIDSAIDFTHIYDLVGDMYCKNNGRPSIDPVVIFKMVLIQHLFGIPSLRKTAEEVRANIYYRWFLGYLLNEKTPHFSTLSYNFTHRYTSEVVESIFYWILSEIEKAGYLEPETVFIDGTHIKANANMKKAVKKAVPKAAKIYEEQLLNEINEDREKHGKKPFKVQNNKTEKNGDTNSEDSKTTEEKSEASDDVNTENKNEENPTETKEVMVSTTDPECGVFHKGEHKKCFAYAAQTACDKNGYILDVTVNPGNVHDSVAFDGLYKRLIGKHPEIKNVVMDAGYKVPYICKEVLDDKRIPVLPYKRPMGGKDFFRPYEYVYDKYYNCVICPENQVLNYSTTNREGYREFKSCPQICENCPKLKNCTNSKNHQKIVTKHIWSEYLEIVEDIRHTPKYSEMYEKRKETIERVFADAKEKHSMRYTNHRGLSRVTNWVRLKFAAMNLKKFAIFFRFRCFFRSICMLSHFDINFYKNIAPGSI